MDIPLFANIFKKDEKEKLDKIKVLSDVKFCKNLLKKDIKKIADIFHERNYKKGEILFKEGNPGSALYLLLEGSVVIQKNDKNNEVIELAQIGKGSFLGELSLLNNSTRSATAKANSETKAILLFRGDFMEFISHHPKIGIKIMKNLTKIIGKRLTATNKRLLEYKAMLDYQKKESEKNE